MDKIEINELDLISENSYKEISIHSFDKKKLLKKSEEYYNRKQIVKI